MRDIPGCEGIYAVTANGAVWSYPKVFGHLGNLRHAGRWLTQRLNPKGYKTVNLQVDGGRRTQLVHRLIALAFIPNPLQLPQINHRDGIKQHNEVENLEWCTGSENVRHALASGAINTRTPAKLAAARKNAIKARAVANAKWLTP